MDEKITTLAQISASRKAWVYFRRALVWRCPVCGRSPMFRPLRESRGLTDWFETLPGCPRCAYSYEQEAGYFMLALWSFDYGPAALVGIGCLLFFYAFFDLSTWQLLLLVLLPTLLFAILIVRHAKALYLALDQYFFYQGVLPKLCHSNGGMKKMGGHPLAKHPPACGAIFKGDEH